jgi:hypothetical protein
MWLELTADRVARPLNRLAISTLRIRRASGIAEDIQFDPISRHPDSIRVTQDLRANLRCGIRAAKRFDMLVGPSEGWRPGDASHRGPGTHRPYGGVLSAELTLPRDDVPSSGSLIGATLSTLARRWDVASSITSASSVPRQHPDCASGMPPAEGCGHGSTAVSLPIIPF